MKFPLSPKEIDAILCIREDCNSFGLDIAKKADITFSHTTKIIKRLKQLRLIKKKVRDGRTKNIILTREGLKLKQALEEAELVLQKQMLRVGD